MTQTMTPTPHEVAALVKRLRETERVIPTQGYVMVGQEAGKAADMLEALSRAHRAGWDAAIEAAALRVEPADNADTGVARALRMAAAGIRALPYPGEKP